MNFALWVGKLISPEHEFIILCDEGREVELITRLARIAYDKVHGYVEGGFAGWKNAGKPVHSAGLIKINEFKKLYEKHKDL